METIPSSRMSGPSKKIGMLDQGPDQGSVMNRVIECEFKLTRVLAMLNNADPKRPSAFYTPPEARQPPLASGSVAFAGYAVNHFELMNELKDRLKSRQV